MDEAVAEDVRVTDVGTDVDCAVVAVDVVLGGGVRPP